MGFIIFDSPLTPRSLPAGVAPGTKVLRASDYQALGDAKALIAAAIKQADQIVADAVAAHEAEKQRGYAEGMAQAQAKAAQQMMETASRTVDYFSKVESTVVDLVMESLRKLIAGFDDRVRVGAVVASALKEVRNQKQITLRMHPDEITIAQQKMQEWSGMFPHMGSVDIVADARLARGACVAESEIGLVEASLDNQLATLRSAFERVLGAHAGKEA